MRSPRAKLGMSAIAAGIIIGWICPLFNTSEQNLSFVERGVLLLALVSIIFGSLVVLSALASGWLASENKSVDGHVS